MNERNENADGTRLPEQPGPQGTGNQPRRRRGVSRQGQTTTGARAAGTGERSEDGRRDGSAHGGDGVGSAATVQPAPETSQDTGQRKDAAEPERSSGNCVGTGPRATTDPSGIAVARKKVKRRVWGRLKNIEVGERLYTFELRKATRDSSFKEVQPAGVLVRQRHSKHTTFISIDRLVGGGGRVVKIGEVEYTITLTKVGLEIQRHGVRVPRLLTYDALERQAKDQPELFTERDVEGRKK